MQSTETQPLTFGIIGCRHGHVHGLIKNLLDIPNVSCAGIYDSDDEAVQEVTDRYSVKRARCAEELLDDPAVQIIGTAEINNAKAPLLLQALKAGKHVIADKPLCTTMDDLNALEAAAKEHGCEVGLLLSERDAPYSRAMKAIVDSGEIGQVANVLCMRPHRLGRNGRPDWMFVDEQYGGIIVDLAIHDLDIIRWVAGGTYQEVTAYQQNFGNPADTDFGDIGTVLARLSTGTTGIVRTDWFTPETSPVHGDTRFIVTGTKGMLEARTAGDLWSGKENRPSELLLMSNDRPPCKVDLVPPENNLVQDFVQSIRCGTERYLSNTDVFEATRATLMARISTRLGRTVTRNTVTRNTVTRNEV